jgi:cyclophilin family peptidyl-prolyl cis-trans isomerase
MRKLQLLAGATSALLLLGQGCAPAPAPEITQVQTPPIPAPAPEPEPVSPPDNSNDQAMNETTYSFPGVLPAEEVNKRVRIQTNVGDIVIDVDPSAGPNAASNFIYLVREGFYDGTIFHRVIPGFMIQGGDPTGTGTGGPGYRFADDPVKGSYAKGTVAMANAGPNTNGSQFFIMVADNPLPPAYSIFGRVVEGQDVADAISAAARNQMDRPLQEIKMVSVTIENK